MEHELVGHLAVPEPVVLRRPFPSGARTPLAIPLCLLFLRWLLLLAL